MDLDHTQPKPSILMREEVLEDGAPLALANLLAHFNVEVGDEKIIALWKTTISKIIEVIRRHMPTVDVIRPKVWEDSYAREKMVASLSLVPVTMDAYDMSHTLKLQVSRHFAVGGKIQLGVGRRPGTPEIDAQIMTIKSAVKNKPIMLLEDDIYTGGTLKFVLEQLHNAHISIGAIVASSQMSRSTELDGMPLKPLNRYERDKILDVVDSRDLLFGLRDAGLVIQDGSRLYRAPYILPWVDVTARMSVPPKPASSFSMDVAAVNRQFYHDLSRIVEREVLIADTDQPFQDFVQFGTDFSSGSRSTMIDFCNYAIDCAKKDT